MPYNSVTEKICKEYWDFFASLKRGFVGFLELNEGDVSDLSSLKKLYASLKGDKGRVERFPMQRAAEILGHENVVTPEDIKKIWKVDLYPSEVPAIPF